MTTSPTPNLLGAGAVIDRAYAEYLTNANLATIIPFDDTIPQVTEGEQILSAAITPKKTTNRIRVRVQLWGINGSTNELLTAAVFLNGAANAIAAKAAAINSGSGLYNTLDMEFEVVPGAVTAQTFTVRVGGSASTIRLNGNTSGRIYGGVSRCTLVLEEIQV